MNKIEINESSGDFPEYTSNEYNLEILEIKNTSYINFFENFMIRNIPCVIKNVSSTWECTNNWIIKDTINTDHFIQRYGGLEAPVANCDSFTYNAQSKVNMKVFDYMKYLQISEREKLLYLKDWHLRRLVPNDHFYDVPLIFGSDWLNEYAGDHKEDDFMFVYIGPKDTWTPLHVDVYTSYSWSVNVIGRKKWILFPPGEEDRLKDSLGNLPLLFSPEEFKDTNYIEVTQEKGDAIFVPSGWHHQVTNLLDTISINHNWINACNIEAVWKALNNSLSSVENEIKEFKDTPDFNSQCQLILKSLFGMDFSNFVIFVTYIGKKRLTQLHVESVGFNNIKLGINHIIFDLRCIIKIMNLICNHPLVLNKYLLPNVESDLVDVKNNISKTMK